MSKACTICNQDASLTISVTLNPENILLDMDDYCWECAQDGLKELELNPGKEPKIKNPQSP